MRQLTEEEIEKFKTVAKKQTTLEVNIEDWNPYELSGGNYDDCYWIGRDDSDIQNARFIIDLYAIGY